MKIAVIGSGKIGSTAAKLFLRADHDVVIANRRGPDSLGPLAAELGPRASAAPVEDAARASELALLAIPFGAYSELPAPAFAGKLVIDANNYYPGRDGHIPELDRGETTSTELTARHLADATLVKSFNTMYYRTLASAGDAAKPEEERLALCLASDDDEATRVVAPLIGAIGFAPFLSGGLADGGRLQQPDGALYNIDLTASQARELLAAR